MKRKSILALTFVFALAFGSRAQAQHGCKPIHAFVQATLPTSTPIDVNNDTWGGPIYANFAGEFFLGALSGNDGTQLGQGAISIFKGGSYKVCFARSVSSGWGGAQSDCSDSFTYEVPSAFVIWPSADRLGSYSATAKIVKGTGRFQSASGHLSVAGPFVLWPDTNSPFGVYGRWDGELSGSICGVQ